MAKYNVIEIDPDYVPAPVERKQVFGVTFEQGRNNLAINRELLENIVTENKELPDNREDRHDRIFDYPEIYTVQLCLLREGWTGDRYRRRSAVPCTLQPVWQVRKPTTGICANLRRC